MSKKKTQEEFVQELYAVDPTIKVTGIYSGNMKKIECTCSICGYKWESRPADLLHGHGCHQCHHPSERKSKEAFETDLAKINPSIKVIGEYINNQTKIECHCTVCGENWFQKPNALLNRRGCPNCNHTSTSFVEQIILLSYKLMLGEECVISRDRKTIGKELDIYLPTKHVAIDYGSWRWHSSTVEKDKQKQSNCADRGIKLITIYDSYPKELLSPFPDAYVFEFPLSDGSGLRHLRDLISSIAHSIGIDKTLTNQQWEEVLFKAYLASRRTATSRPNYGTNDENRFRRNEAEFIEYLQSRNPLVEYISGYKGIHSKILVKCKTCGYEWEPEGNSLLYKEGGCPKCSKKYRRNEAEFIEYLQLKNPTVKYISGYDSVKSKVHVICRLCGYEWETTGYSLLAGHKCSNCSHPSKKKTNDQFVNELREIRPDIVALDNYEGKDIKIRFQCKSCGYIWESTPHSILAQKHCPECWKTIRKQNRLLTNEEFIARVRERCPNVIVLDHYKDSISKVRCQCAECGHQWSVVAGNLTKGYPGHKCK